MGIIHFIDNIYKEQRYRCQKYEKSFLMFSTLNYYYGVKFSNKITNNIWLGNYIDSSNETFIRNNNIRVIVNCSKNLPFYMDDAEVPFRYRIPVDDDRAHNSIELMYLYLPKIVQIMKYHISRGENIYVHCHAGMQRSATVIAAYLMNQYGLDMYEAMSHIKKYRSIAFTPFINFERSLEQYGSDLKTSNTIAV